jgi:hypothetical protein
MPLIKDLNVLQIKTTYSVLFYLKRSFFLLCLNNKYERKIYLDDNSSVK